MPELPEVELTRENLNQWTLGQASMRLELKDPSLLIESHEPSLSRSFLQETWSPVLRRGKFMLWPCEKNKALVMHMAMTGKWVSRPSGSCPRGTRAQLHMKDGTALCFVDQRRFGKFWWGDRKTVEQLSGWNRLGPDAWTQRDLAIDRLKDRALRTKRSIISVLMDQAVVSGVGNILANEALFLSGIQPLSRACDLSPPELELVMESIGKTIEVSLQRDKGTEILYQGEKGSDNPFLVYGKENFPCPRCASLVIRLKHAGRSVFLCTACQRMPLQP